ncbi:MAG: DUF3224 domain-containing protein [Anaerolineaceae bacterium]|nr:DUF3224 domain-containing protein [Anaerolineaceae bacterium]
MKITGKFDVQLEPLESYAQGEDGMQLGRMAIDKTFHGELSAISKGEMLSVQTTVKGSAGYVAIEQVSGILSGKKGSFVLQHFATIMTGEKRMILEVVPDSGSGQLEGLSGKMLIIIKEGEHNYEFNYQLI